MAPEYGATCGFSPIDEETIRYLETTSRPAARSRWCAPMPRRRASTAPRTRPTRCSPKCSSSSSRSVEPSLAGPKRPQDRVLLKEAKASFATALDKEFGKGGVAHRRHCRRSSVACHRAGAAADAEGGRQQARAGRRAQFRPRPWRRRHCGDHLVHQHFEPERDGGGRAARPQGARARPQAQAVGQDLARARLAGRRGISARRPGCRTTSMRSASTSWHSAAPPASAIPARCRRRFPRRSTTTTWCAPRSCRATAISRRG